MKTWLSDMSIIGSSGVEAMRRGEKSCAIKTRMAVRLPGGIKVSDMITMVKIEVTFGERAAGAIRGEAVDDVASRETKAAALAAASAISDMVVRDAERVRDLRGQVENLILGINPDSAARKPWRARALAYEIRDLLDDHARTGVRAVLRDLPKDVISIEAWRPVSTPDAISLNQMASRVLTGLNGGSEDRAIATLTEIRDTLRSACDGGFEVWGDPLPSDIAMMTSNMTIRNLLEQAASLRDRAAEFSSRDPEKAAGIITEAREVESRALSALDQSRDEGDIDRLQDMSSALKMQADMELK